MSQEQNSQQYFIELMSRFTKYNDIFNAIYCMKTHNAEEINKIYKLIDVNLIQTNFFAIDDILTVLITTLVLNNRYAGSYFQIYKKIRESYENMSKKAATISFFETFQSTHNSLNVHEENTIYWAIMYDDIKLFISFTERESFDANMALVSDYYPITGNVYSLLELCCYYGSVNCFKFLRTEFNLQINHTCLEFSFLGGKPDIMNECLKYQTPDQNCMVLAIASHNIDFVTFLMNEYDLKIDLSACIKFNNLQAFFVYLDQTKDLNECYILSPSFHIPSICEYFLENNVKIDATDSENEKTALHNAAYYNCVEVMQFLLSHGLCVEEKSKYLKTPLHFAAENNSIESVEFLLSNGAKIDARAYYMETPLHYACNYNCIETVKLLILNGANINAKTKQSKTALHFAVKNNCKNIVNILITYGISLNIRDKSRKTAL